MGRAYYTGLMDVYYAAFSTADSKTAAPTYGDPALLGMGIEVTISPRIKEGSLYASNVAVRRTKKLDGYDVTINADQIEPDVRKAVLGRKADSVDVQIVGGDTQAPYVALGLGITKDDGTKELWWLYKGKFDEIETKATTEGENIEYTTPQLKGVFDRRIYDDRLAAVFDTADEAAQGTVGSTWFDDVYEATGTIT